MGKKHHIYCITIYIYIYIYYEPFRIGYAIANRLAYDGAKVMVSSRKGTNVKRAVELLQKEHGSESVSGVVCHVGKDEDRKSLIKEVLLMMFVIWSYIQYYSSNANTMTQNSVSVVTTLLINYITTICICATCYNNFVLTIGHYTVWTN